MNKSNIQIAKEYATMMYALTKNDGIWVSNNLPEQDRSAILSVYKSIFPVVDYDTKSGVCICRKSSLPEAA